MKHTQILVLTALAVILSLAACDPTPIPRLSLPAPDTEPRPPTATPQVISTPYPSETLGGPTDQTLSSADNCDGEICEPFDDKVPPAYLVSDDSNTMREIYTGTGGINTLQPTPDATQIAFTDNYTLENSDIYEPEITSDKTTSYLPLITKRNPPLPDTPILNAIDNPCPSRAYCVSWQAALLAENYTLQEADDAAFNGAWNRYHGPETSWSVVDQPMSIYFYRVKATNAWGESAWSNVQKVYVLPPSSIPAQADTMVASGYPQANFSDAPSLSVGYDTFDDPDSLQMRGLLRFDLSVVPPGIPIDSVWLWLYHKSSFDIPGIAREINIAIADDRWEEYNVIWDTRPCTGQNIGQLSVLYAEWGWYLIDVTDLALEWINGQRTNYGIVILGDEDLGEPNWRGFCTRELDENCAPRLTIHYTGASNPVLTYIRPAPAPLILPQNNDTPEATAEP